MDSFSDFIKLCKSIKNLESIEDENIRIALRNLIDRIVNKITYDGETNEVSIDIWGIKKTNDKVDNLRILSQYHKSRIFMSRKTYIPMSCHPICNFN